MLQSVARLALAAPRRVIAGVLLVLCGAAVFGVPVTNELSNGGFRDPTSQSWHAGQLLADKFGAGNMALVIGVSSADGVQSAAARRAGLAIVDQLSSLPYITNVQSAWTSPASSAPMLIGEGNTTGLIVAGITGGESGAQAHAVQISAMIPGFDDVTVELGGEAMSYVQILDQTKKDLMFMEVIAFPVSFVVLVWVFGGLLAAALPLAVGVCAIVGSMAVMRAVALGTEVSIFALNLILAMGLALAIDYTLLIVSRYRDELAAGAARDAALVRTMATAGRTVLFSAVTVALSMAALAFFPMYFLKSFAYAGVAVVAFAVAAALVVTPVAIVLLGDRLNALDVRRAFRRMLGRQQRGPHPVEQMFWYRWTKIVMRHAVPISITVTAVLILLGVPFLGVKWGYPDERILPQSASARQLGDEIRSDFAIDSTTDVTVVIPDTSGLISSELDRYAADLSRVRGVSAVSAPGGAFVDGLPAGPPRSPVGWQDGSAFLTVNSSAPLYSAESEAQLDALHAVAPPGGRDAQFAGWAQINRDGAVGISSRLPLVLSVIATVTFLLMFLITGSLVIPLKTLVLNALSLTAAFGALVWVFQDGHLGGLGTTATGTLVASVPVLLFCLAFGLSMDYEVFLISRIREFWLASGRRRADNDESVARGLAHTGRVVTAAALLMSVTFASLMAAEVSVMKMFGLGVPLAVLMDATLVRMLLVPAFMRVLGRFNWWAPPFAAKLHRRFGVGETPPVPAPAVLPRSVAEVV